MDVFYVNITSSGTKATVSEASRTPPPGFSPETRGATIHAVNLSGTGCNVTVQIVYRPVDPVIPDIPVP
jgi:hypothetical protein